MSIQFWVAVGKVKQLAFRDDGSRYEIDVDENVGEQHIVYNGVLLCRQSRETLKGKLGAKKQKTVANRIPGIPLCSRCEKKFKENSDLGWVKWINPPELKRSPTTIKVNPILLGETNDNQRQMVQNESRKEPENTGKDSQADQAGIFLHS